MTSRPISRPLRADDALAAPLVTIALMALRLFAVALMAVGLVAQTASTASAQTPLRLTALGATLTETTVSGISSGAYMAGQFQLAHGDVVVGAAIIAGGPFGCAESMFADIMSGPGMMLFNMSKAVNGCMLNMLSMFGIPDPKGLARRAKTLAERGDIAPIKTVTSDRIYLFSGKADTFVRPEIVAAAREFYIELGIPESQLAYVHSMNAGHAFVTRDTGGACAHSGQPYIVNCDYDQAGALLTHFFGRLSPRVAKPAGEFKPFDQSEFLRDLGDHGLDDIGVVYVPPACRDGAGCRVHIAFHGCSQNRDDVKDAFIKGTELAEWSDNNRMIVLFPQVRSSVTNPQGCWDWWGYTGSEFLTKRAPQIVAVRRMLDRLSTNR